MEKKKSTGHPFPKTIDILSEIFNRLPLKCLGGYMLVQKSWYFLIKSPDFIKLHLNYQKDSCLYLLFSSASKSPFSVRFDYKQCDYKLQFPPGGGTSYGMSNGVLCLSSFELKHDSNIYLWNPTIRKTKTLPDTPLHFDTSSNLIDNCRVNMAFGYSTELNDYQVVKIVMCPMLDNKRLTEWSVIVDVYSLSSNSWETVKYDDNVDLRYELRNNSVFVNSCAYWLGKKQLDRDVVVGFSLKNKNISEIKLPKECSLGKTVIQACGESLSLFDYNCKSGMLELWILTKKTGNTYVEWKRKMSINLEGIYEWLPLGFRNNGEIILRKKNASGFVSYNNENGEVREFADLKGLWPFNIDCFVNKIMGIDCYSNVHVPTFSAFVESLVLLGDASLVLLGDADASDMQEKPRRKAKGIFNAFCFACFS